MRNPLSKKIIGIEPSGIRKFFDIVSEMPDAISLGVGEPDFDTPWNVREEGIYTLEKGRTFYTSNAGLKELREEISRYVNRKYDLHYDPMHEIFVTVGGSEAIDVALRCMTDPGDEVLIPQPSYVSYLPCAVMADAVPVPIELKAENDFKLTKEQLLSSITEKTKILVLPYPNNPTGAIMTKEELESLMDTKWAGKNIVYYDEVDSTNLRIKQLGDEGAPEGTLAVADRQTAGRGRRGRSWDSPAGESISMSILLRPQITPNQAPMLTLVMACSVAEGIMDCKDVCGEQQIQIKWPNDIIIHGKKLVGILTEMSTQIDYINHVTVGVGINVNLTDFPEEIREHATSLRLECGHKVKRAPLIAAIMKRLEENYALFMETGDLSQLMEKYSELLVNKDRDVMILGAKEQYVAHALGINKTGELIVRKEDGTIEEVYAGEVSVRGVYGYV